MFTTEQLRLRGYRTSDSENLMAMMTDASIMATSSNNYLVPRPQSTIEKYLDGFQQALMFVVIETKDSAIFVGVSSLRLEDDNPKNRDVLFGVALKPSFWNMGYGKEITRFMVDHAFRHLGMHRVSLTVYEWNPIAFEMYRKIGFIEEGRRRKSNWTPDGWQDTISMGILAEEWDETLAK
ncbi:acyl-CoA N-acyltransferase [Mycena floridula]|nr:acyl-CoA N-acyltransferase [Mycena floridula]